MPRRFQFSLRRLFRWTTCAALSVGALLWIVRMPSFAPSVEDSAIGLLWLSLAAMIAVAAFGAILDKDMIRGLLVGAGLGLALVTMLALSCSHLY